MFGCFASLGRLWARLWLQPFAWTLAFGFWFQLFCSAFLGGVLDLAWWWEVPLGLGFVVLWLLAVSSLYKCLFTRPPLVPPAFGVPARLVRLLSAADRRDYRASEPRFSSGDESDGSGGGGGASTASSDSDGSGSEGEGDAERRRTRKWEAFYRGLVAMAAKRRLNVRTSPLTFGEERLDVPDYCTRCEALKPRRTHHCRRCGTCVVRMDHHCPAIGKCVHLANHKFFLVFLAWAAALCCFAAAAMAPSVTLTAVRFVHAPEPKSAHLFTPMLFAITGCVQAALFALLLAYFQWGFWTDALADRTTLEDMGAVLQPKDEPTEKPAGSKLRNLEGIFGPDRRLWFLPVQSADLTV